MKEIQKKDKLEQSFRATWSAGLASKGYTQIANAFLENYHKLGISPIQAMFIIHIFKYKWTVSMPFPSFMTIAEQMGRSRNSVQRIARDLERKGLIKRKFRKHETNIIDLSPLISQIETSSKIPKLDRYTIQKLAKPHLNIDTKENPLIRKGNNGSLRKIGYEDFDILPDEIQ